MNQAIARRYAHALFGLVRRDDGDAVQEGLRALAQAVTRSAALRHSVASPAVARDEKLEVLDALCERTGGPPVLGRFCKQLLTHHRLGCLPEIADAFQSLLARQRGTQPVDVVAAHPMDDGRQRDLRATLRSTLNRDVEVRFHSDPSLLSGLRVRVGGAVYDGTLKGQLNRMRARLIRE